MTTAELPHRLAEALSARDLDAVVDCFSDDYVCVVPIRPSLNFSGREAVRANYATIFKRLPDFRAMVLDQAAVSNDVWTEWEITGTTADGDSERIVGVVVFHVLDGRAVSARFYLEQVIHSGDNPVVHA